jgi:CheY-like chemotaxis protein
LKKLLVSLFLTLFALAQTQGQESEFYKKPTNTAEYWRALTFEINVGKYEIAAAHLHNLVLSNPKDADLLIIESKDGLAAFLRLRNVERWSVNKEAEKDARADVEKLIQMVNDALKKELGDPVRIAKFARNLTATPEEAAFAIKELVRSGVEAVPILIEMLRSDQPAAQRAAILDMIPYFDSNVVPAWIACLDVNDVALKMDLLDALRKRKDYLTFPARVETDLTPNLWYFSAPLAKNPELLRKKAREMLLGLLDRDPNADRVEDHRLPQWRLAQFTRQFLEHQKRFTGNDQATVWKWDGAHPVAATMSFADAEEYYGLRFGRWALEIQADYPEAQKAFLTLALEKQFARSGADAPLIKSSPSLYAVLASAPFELLSDLTETYLREKRVLLATALLQAIGDRNEVKAARPSDKPGAPGAADGYRPSLLLKALEYPDRRVRFAAVDAMLKAPNPQVQARGATIVKVLAGQLQADTPEDAGKPHALIGDPDRLRAEMLAGVVRRAGYRVDIIATGRDLMRRLQDKADIDLVILDHHIVYPMFADTLAQLRADVRTSGLPVAVVASGDQSATAHPITLLGRLAALVAASEHLNLYRDQEVIDDPRRDAAANRFKKRLDTLRQLVESAGIRVSPDVADRLEYLVYMTTLPEIDVPPELRRTRLVVSPDERDDRMRALQNDPKHGHIAATESPFANTRDLTPALAVILARYELALPQDVLDLAKPYWQVLQYGYRDAKSNRVLQEPLPAVAIKNIEAETRAKRLTRGFQRLRVIPEVFTEEALKEELQGLVAQQDPKQMEADRKANGKAALEWLRKMAVGELKGYPVADAAATLRQALRNPELTTLALDVVARLAGPEAQQDIANVVLGMQGPEIQVQAADALIRHIQERGKMISDPQRMLLIEKAASEPDPLVKGRLQALRGILQPDAKATGQRLLDFTPGPAPKEMKEEPKDKKDDPKN